MVGTMKLEKIFIAGVLSTSVGLGVTISELDDFNAASGAPNPLESWEEGAQTSTGPIHELTGGPDGSGYLRDFANGVSQGGKVQLWNTDQWTGNFVGQSIVTLSLDAINLSGVGGETLHFRVAFNGPGGWFVSSPQDVEPETGWHSLSFDLSLGALEHAGQGDGAYDSTMSAVNRMQIISLDEGGAFVISTNSGLRGDSIVASWGLDNIRAGGAIPESSSMLLSMLGGIGVLRRKRS